MLVNNKLFYDNNSLWIELWGYEFLGLDYSKFVIKNSLLYRISSLFLWTQNQFLYCTGTRYIEVIFIQIYMLYTDIYVIYRFYCIKLSNILPGDFQ